MEARGVETQPMTSAQWESLNEYKKAVDKAVEAKAKSNRWFFLPAFQTGPAKSDIYKTFQDAMKKRWDATDTTFN